MTFFPKRKILGLRRVSLPEFVTTFPLILMERISEEASTESIHRNSLGIGSGRVNSFLSTQSPSSLLAKGTLIEDHLSDAVSETFALRHSPFRFISTRCALAGRENSSAQHEIARKREMLHQAIKGC